MTDNIDNETNGNTTESELTRLLNENDNLNKEIYKKEREIELAKKNITQNEKAIWKLCNHEWKRDHTVAFDDHIKYYCQKCLLWRNHYMYE